MRKFHELAEDDPVWTGSAALTVGSVARALGNSKEALASTSKLADRVDDIDQLLEDLAKSNAVIAECLKGIEARTTSTVDQIAKIGASIDAPGLLAKLANWERDFYKREHAASGSRISLDEYISNINSEREAIRKRDAFDDGVDETSPARFKAQYRIVR